MKESAVLERPATKSKYIFRDNKQESRYELDLGDGFVATIDYFVTPAGNIALTHTEVPYEYEGHGVGTELVAQSLEDIKSKHVMVIPQCGFVASYIRRNPEWQAIVARRF